MRWEVQRNDVFFFLRNLLIKSKIIKVLLIMQKLDDEQVIFRLGESFLSIKKGKNFAFEKIEINEVLSYCFIAKQCIFSRDCIIMQICKTVNGLTLIKSHLLKREIRKEPFNMHRFSSFAFIQNESFASRSLLIKIELLRVKSLRIFPSQRSECKVYSV